jgi:hypothetical protein
MDATELPNAAFELARDAFYVTVGLGVIAVQNADDRRQRAFATLEERLTQVRARLDALDLPTVELPTIDLTNIDLPRIDLPKIDLPTIELGQGIDRDRLHHAIDALNERFEDRSRQLEDRFTQLEATFEARLDTVLDRVEDTLPVTARDAMAQARSAAKDATDQLRTRVRRAA